MCRNADVEQPCLSVIIPVFNERVTISKIVSIVCAQAPVAEVIVVDDYSTDGTREVLARIAQENPRVKVVLHEKNKGKGAALQTGIPLATAPYVLVQDADLEYDPEEYYLLLKPLIDGKADVVFGTRFGGSGTKRVLYFWHTIGNCFLTLVSNMFTNLNLTDMETCYKVFKREVLQDISIEEQRFGFEPEIVAKISKCPGIRIFEVPISYYGRTYAEGKKIGWKDGIRAIWCILKYNLFTQSPWKSTKAETSLNLKPSPVPATIGRP